MPSKYQMYRQMARDAAKEITGSYQSWTGFLKTAARLYKYPYHEQLMIYAQRPDATACAEYDLWNKTMGRFIRRGSKGIALIDADTQTPSLRYVFDVADTGETEHSRSPWLWQLREEHKDAVSEALSRNFDLGRSPDLRIQMEQTVRLLAGEYWLANQQDILRNIDGSLLSEYDSGSTWTRKTAGGEAKPNPYC